MKQRLLLILIFFQLALIANGQKVSHRTVNEYVTHVSFDNKFSGKSPAITFEKPVTSVSIRYEGLLEGTSIEAGDKKYRAYVDDHAEAGLQETALIIFDAAFSELRFSPGPGIKKIIHLSAIHAPTPSATAEERINNEDGCDEPEMILQSSWRQGLPAPTTSRSFSSTRNVIVHHAASDNSLTNFTNVVRNIYLFHTQDRGWSDIGYNYLIAQDGTIYAGRDPINGQQDQVIGAHFCGRNTGTMGVCLLGNLSLVTPTEEALTSLNSLITWKILKDQLNAEGIASHPLNPELPVIAGHRDGCSTQCPGNFTYPLLPGIRQRVQQTVDECLNPEEPDEPERFFAVGPNPAFTNLLNVRLPNDVTPKDVFFTDLNGKPFTLPLTYFNESSMQLDLSDIPKGVYILTIETPGFSTREKVIKN